MLMCSHAGDVDEIHWDHLDGELRTPAEHCQYKFLGHVEGWAYSGHLKWVALADHEGSAS